MFDVGEGGPGGEGAGPDGHWQELAPPQDSQGLPPGQSSFGETKGLQQVVLLEVQGWAATAVCADKMKSNGNIRHKRIDAERKQHALIAES